MPKTKLVSAPIKSKINTSEPATKSRSLTNVPDSPVTDSAPTMRPTAHKMVSSSMSSCPIDRDQFNQPARSNRCSGSTWLISSNTALASHGASVSRWSTNKKKTNSPNDSKNGQPDFKTSRSLGTSDSGSPTNPCLAACASSCKNSAKK